MKKVLFTATVDSHIRHFHIPYLKYFKDRGFEVHVATNGNESIPFCDKKHVIPFERSPFKAKNLKAIRALKKIVDNEMYDVIHTHTPIGSVVTRIAAIKARKQGTKVIYTAHGFHFYKGAPIINWILYYPLERFLARSTDIIITINKEDYERANKSFKAGKVEYVPGVGIDIVRFSNIKIENKKLKRKELGLPEEEFLILSVGELNKNKNHEFIIRALVNINNSNIHYVICGEGSLKTYLKKLIKELGLDKQVHLLGYRNDIPEIYKISDLFVFPSFREGLPVALMEAMATGLPVICSNIRGNTDLIKDEKGGYLFNLNNMVEFNNKIMLLINCPETREKFIKNNLVKINDYEKSNVSKQMKEIYKNI
jgi:glycosyltransferase involved in cell wall biosynthesis